MPVKAVGNNSRIQVSQMRRSVDIKNWSRNVVIPAFCAGVSERSDLGIRRNNFAVESSGNSFTASGKKQKKSPHDGYLLQGPRRRRAVTGDVSKQASKLRRESEQTVVRKCKRSFQTKYRATVKIDCNMRELVLLRGRTSRGLPELAKVREASGF